MLDIYDSERMPIMKVSVVMQNKWNEICKRVDTKNFSSKKNSDMMTQWAEEATNRFRDLGYVVEVDITPALGNIAPPTISFVDRVEKEEFDFDKMSHEVKKASE